MCRKATYYRSASIAALSTLPVIAACALLGATGARAETCAATPCDPYVVSIQQEGNNVVATGSGEFNLAGLTPTTASSASFPAQIGPTFGLLVMAPFGTLGGQRANFAGRTTGTAAPAFPGQPSNFGTSPPFTTGASGMTTAANPLGCTSGANCINATGPVVAFGQNSNPSFGLSVPAGYTSGTVLSPTTVIFGPTALLPNLTPATLASLGITTTGLFEWMWGDAPDQSFTIAAGVPPPSPSEIPAPAALPLFATGLGALGLLGRRRKRKSRAGVA